MAELSDAEKDSISHRGRAARELTRVAQSRLTAAEIATARPSPA